LTRTGRLLSLLQLLRGRTQPVTAATLSTELGVSERTLYRDIAELVVQGAPIYGEAGVGYVLRQGMFLPPLMLSNEETEAVVLGLRYVDQFGDALLRSAAREASAKIASVLSPAARATLSDPIALPGPNGQEFPDTGVPYAILRSSISAQRKLSISYQDANGVRSERIVWPIALGFMQQARVVVAYCETRNAFRTFRTDRIVTAEPLPERYAGRRSALLRTWYDEMDRERAIAFVSDDSGDESLVSGPGGGGG